MALGSGSAGRLIAQKEQRQALRLLLAVGVDWKPFQIYTVGGKAACGVLSVLSLRISEILSCPRQ